MIILLGPDSSGKTTLARKLGLPYYHFDKASKYEDYLKPLCSLEMADAVLDRHMICEYPYMNVMKRPPAFTMKQWHNVLLLTLIQNPLIILCTHKPYSSQYKKEQYLPYEEWDRCLTLYKYFLHTHHIRYIEYDYGGPITIGALEKIHAKNKASTAWWVPMWRMGWGCIGSPYPKVLLVAERIGPNNVNNLPFETGPTGAMLTEMLVKTGTPLGKFAVTNMVKAPRRDPRPPCQSDMDLLFAELVELKPEKVVFMGTPARQGAKVAKDLGIPWENMVHFGYYSHRNESPTALHEQWIDIMGITR